uniref:Protein FAR1-RELATED SEQUENCE n=1 Tax=Rhizophora mucronata TaxID=61149 RepID=A0A2P2KB86_RHIMU
MDPNFFYVVDLNEKGYMRNLFWADARSRVAYRYFGDVVAIDCTCLANKYKVPLVLFLGVNHHGQSILLGCGLLAGETTESYTWLLRAWLTCMLGRPPQAIITDHCKTLQNVIADVFPRASHCIFLSSIMQNLPENLGLPFDLEAIKAELTRVIHYFLRPEEFEAAWVEMTQRQGIKDQKWIQSIYKDRKHWVPAYLKEIFLAGMYPLEPNETVTRFFEGYLDEHTTLKDFFNTYHQALQSHHQHEALADIDSRNLSFLLKSRSYVEMQLSKLYTNKVLRRFQREVEGMYSCFSTRQVNADGPVITYMVKEKIEVEGNRRETKDFEVIYNATEMDIVCVCGLFNFRGYLCRHSLCVLSQNGTEELPPQYILMRWRKDVKRSYVLDNSCTSSIDTNNPIHRYDHLYKCIVRVVEEGGRSEDRRKVTLQGLEQILSKLHLAEDQPRD